MIKRLVVIMPRHISVEKKALIAEAISASLPKPDLPYIAELFETTIKTVRKIRDDIKEEYFGGQLAAEKSWETFPNNR
jgi:hypothetical protein